jgi:putative peptidoglycan lipid II flippase
MSSQLPTLFKVGFTFFPRLKLKDPGLQRTLRLMIPATIGLSATQINIFINTNFAASCAEGSVSWLQYAFRLVQLPIGIFGVAFSIAAMPLLAKQAAKKDIHSMKNTLVSSLTMVFSMTIPATAGLMILSTPIIQLIFERGAFIASDTTATAQALSLYAIGLFAYSANKVLVPVFYALDDTRFPVIASFISVLVNIVIINSIIEYFRHLAIALSMSITMAINFIFLATIIYIKIRGFPLKQLIQGLLKILVATFIMSCFLYPTFKGLQGWISLSTLHLLSGLFLLISISVVLYFFTIMILRLEEFELLAVKLRNKFSPSK